MSIRAAKNRQAFEAEYQKEQEQKELERTASIRAQAQRNAELEAQIAETEKAIVRDTVFKQPSEHLGKVCTRYSRDLTVAQVTAAIGEAVSALKLYLDSAGKEITNSGLAKIGRVSELNQDIDTTSPDNLKRIFEYLDANGCFTNADVKVTRVIQPTEPAPAPVKRTLEQVQAELDGLRGVIDTPVGRLKARQLKGELLSLEVLNSGLWAEWCEFVRKNYDPFDAAEQERCTGWLASNDLILNVANLNRYRVQRGWVNADEALAQTIENHEGRIDEYETKKDIANRIRAIKK